MNFSLEFLYDLFGRRQKIPGVPENLRKIIDRYDTAALLTVYDVEEPNILYANGKHKKLTGYKTEEVIGEKPRMFQGKNTSDKVKKEMRQELSKSSFWHGRVVNYKRSGEETYINLVIFAITYEGHKYYVALKKVASEE